MTLAASASLEDPSTPPAPPRPATDACLRWRAGLAWATGGWLLFETLTGASIYLLPFSLTNQMAVLLHTALGVVFLLPVCWYLARHWTDHRAYGMNHRKATGYAGLATLAVCVVSGAVLTVQALFARRISQGWDLVHLLSTLALLAFALPHVATIWWGERRRGAESGIPQAIRRYALGALGTAAAGGGLVAASVWAFAPPPLQDAFPDGYRFTHGRDRPFAPSLARTDTGGAFDAETLAGSASCGTSGCHEQIAAEWAVSAHRWAAMDVAFQKVQETMAQQNGPEATRYCGGCHDPISLLSGQKRLLAKALTSPIGSDEGVSCLVCHGVRETDLKGNANYVLSRPARYAFELRAGASDLARLARDFLLRAYPRHHRESLTKRLFKSPAYCAACHKQFIDEEVNNVGWVQLQNQYDNWRKSRWNHPGDAQRTIECRECHMPLTDSTDPAAGDDLDYNRSPRDGKHRSHRFLAANQAMPLLLKLPGAKEQIELTERWLRGEIRIPEIEKKWREGPAVPIEVRAPASVRVGEPVKIDVRITSNKVGHAFPTGPLDIIEAWLEVTVTDAKDRVVFRSGALDERHFVPKGSFVLKAEPVDQTGKLIDRHNLWELVGVRYKRTLFPGAADVATYEFPCPGFAAERRPPREDGRSYSFAAPAGAGGRLRVRAKLRYRKFGQGILNFVFGEESGLTAPVTDVSEAEAWVAVAEGA